MLNKTNQVLGNLNGIFCFKQKVVQGFQHQKLQKYFFGILLKQMLRQFLYINQNETKRMKENQKNNTRLGWTPQEQKMLQSLYDTQEIKSWIKIAKCMNRLNEDFSRSAKQCRERYNNFIKFKTQTNNSSEWSDEENKTLFNLYMKKGSKWVQIAKLMNKRSENFIKNRFYGSLRKLINMINKSANLSRKKKKPIKYQTIIKILQRSNKIEGKDQEQEQNQVQKLIFCQEIKNDILKAASLIPENLSQQKIEDLILRTHKFNIITRFQNMARNRGFKCNKKKITSKNFQNNDKQSKIMSKSFCNEEKTSINLFMDKKETQMQLLQESEFFQFQSIPKDTNALACSYEKDLEQDLCQILKKTYEPDTFKFFLPL